MVVEVSFFTRVCFTQVLSLTEKVLCLFCQKKIRKERAKALAGAVSGEALLYEGTILANASAVGMEPNTDQTPVSKVLSLTLSEQIDNNSEEHIEQCIASSHACLGGLESI